jgi:hypothetical protein
MQMRRLSPQRLLNISLIVIFILLVLPIYVSKGMNDSLDHARGTGTVGGIDFKAYYIAADMLRAGKDFYDVELQTQEVLERGLPLNESFYIYPPWLAISFFPLAALPMHSAAQLWFFINLGLYGLSLILIGRALDLDRLTRMLPLLWILAFLFAPALLTLYKGQVNILILFLLAMTYWLYRKGMQTMAGLALGLAVMIKIIPICLLAYFLWKRRYALSLAAVGTIVVISILGLMVVGLTPHKTYLTEVWPSLAQPRPNPANQSLGGFFSLLFIENVYTDYFIHNPTLWKALTWVFSLALVAATAGICSRRLGGELRLELEISLVIATMPLIANIAWVDMFVLLVFPYAVLLKYFLIAQRERPSIAPLLRKALVGCSCASVLLVSFPRFLDLFANFVGEQNWLMHSPLFLSLPIYGLAILWLALALILIAGKRASNHALLELR